MRISRSPKLAQFVLFCLSLQLASDAESRLRPVVNVLDSMVPDGLTLKQVKKAIIRGGVRRNWIIREVMPGRLEATLNVRHHKVRSIIHYSVAEYSITYKDSVNMKYDKGRIHGRYNDWVKNLDSDIRREMKTMLLANLGEHQDG